MLLLHDNLRLGRLHIGSDHTLLHTLDLVVLGRIVEEIDLRTLEKHLHLVELLEDIVLFCLGEKGETVFSVKRLHIYSPLRDSIVDCGSTDLLVLTGISTLGVADYNTLKNIVFGHFSAVRISASDLGERLEHTKALVGVLLHHDQLKRNFVTPSVHEREVEGCCTDRNIIRVWICPDAERPVLAVAGHRNLFRVEPSDILRIVIVDVHLEVLERDVSGKRSL